MAEAEEHGQIPGEVDEVPRLIGQPLTQATPGGETEDEDENGAHDRGDHPVLLSPEVDDARDDGASGRCAPRPGVGDHVDEERESGDDAEPPVRCEQVVLTVATLEPRWPGGEDQAAEGRQSGDEPGYLAETGERVRTATEQRPDTAVDHPDAEGDCGDESADGQQVGREEAGCPRPRQTTHHGALTGVALVTALTLMVAARRRPALIGRDHAPIVDHVAHCLVHEPPRLTQPVHSVYARVTPHLRVQRRQSRHRREQRPGPRRRLGPD